ncbi:restriction endonuclease subunit S [Clostridium saccharobutylicum]|uniref:restriction endonuclease subunit S n=2 Tax=Clostridium saccharobutylicum TaxID=169679 RepID=UPI0017E756A5|nr:restriction endonuclease subunit S [Clostridium saccharobutylicum]MBA2905663.1 type I restriction enzyme S subunit [Clostridium saccharobutylicum]MBA8792341.1 type I restriction enzyme S subunit [Clostridium saccharobutylicum]MBA8982409.1 type I restriction enzyme S subunit [Clostridium saccharobutylicum]MBA8994445.1 type I restriction enzyme S subunit [Clostridium saccharobutylicum]MBA9000667.1 type I restriction enzyme S subunit [Clostridium saccharobutylicum]
MKNIELPKDWKMDTLDNATSIIRNGANIKQGEDGGYPITRIETISNSFIDINKFGYAGIEELGKYKDYLLQQGDILMSHINSEKHLGKVAIYENCNIEIIHGMNLLCIRFNNEIILSKYAYYFLNTKRFKIQLPRITKKSVNQASFSINDLKNLKIIIPPLEIQKKIINVLEKSEKALEKRMESIKLLDELVKSRFIEMFGDPALNPKGWEKGKIADIVIKTQYGTGSKADEKNGEFKVLRMNNITYNGQWDFSSMKYVDLDEKEQEKYLVYKGEVLFNRTNSKELVGKTAVYKEEEPMAYAGYLVKAIPNERANGEFISTYMNSKYIKSRLLNMAKNIVGMANINAEEFKKIDVYIPPIELQNQFADFVKQVDKLKFEMQKSLEEMENNFNSLMQRAFKGELFN